MKITYKNQLVPTLSKSTVRWLQKIVMKKQPKKGSSGSKLRHLRGDRATIYIFFDWCFFWMTKKGGNLKSTPL